MELAHLRLADRHIAEGELRIAAQFTLVEKLRRAKRSTGPAEDMLELLRTTMVAWQYHRSLIVASLNDG